MWCGAYCPTYPFFGLWGRFKINLHNAIYICLDLCKYIIFWRRFEIFPSFPSDITFLPDWDYGTIFDQKKFLDVHHKKWTPSLLSSALVHQILWCKLLNYSILLWLYIKVQAKCIVEMRYKQVSKMHVNQCLNLKKIYFLPHLGSPQGCGVGISPIR